MKAIVVLCIALGCSSSVPSPAHVLRAHARGVRVRPAVALEDIVVMESEGNYTKLAFGGATPMLARSLGALEARLDPELFFRANRRQIINRRHVRSLEPALDGGLRATLTGDLVVQMSRRQARKFAATAGL